MAIASRISTGLFPEGAGAFVRKRLAELGGFALAVLIVALIVTMMINVDR